MTENTIRFAKERGFFLCENDVFSLQLSPIEKLTYLALVRYCDTQQRAWPSYNRLAKDVGIGKKRAIEAVKTLIDCNLLEKKVRGNRSNIYLVYPARFFCCPQKVDKEEGKEPAEGVQEKPQDLPEVSYEHPQGVPPTPSGCPVDTLRVSNRHPISTKTSIRNNTLSSQETEREKVLKQAKRKTEIMVMTVSDLILRKGYQVNKRVIEEMLDQYSIEEINAAIECTDFKKARNPLAVIFALLKSGRYVIPKPQEQNKPKEQIVEPEELDKEVLQKYINTIRGTLALGNDQPENGDGKP